MELLTREFPVRVLARNPSHLPEHIREQVEVFRGSTDNVAVLRRALEGAEALFWCVPSAPVHDVNVRAHYERFALAGYQAIRDVGTGRVVTISAAGSAFGGSAGRTSGLHAMEDILDRSGTSIKHLRCGDKWFEPVPVCTMRAA
jgi:uncharacterized protein YbjT (DUF2867 family)